MKVAALCITLMMNVLMLMAAHVLHSYAQKDDADSLHISGSRLQYFEHELVALTCVGFDDVTNWRVMREIKGVVTICATAWDTSTGQCTIKNAFPGDSGTYWCQGTEEQRSNTVTIHVSAGSVILESPVLPVMEGEAVTLLCRQRKTSGNLPADFYKDGDVIQTSDTGEMTIHNISRSDEGLYKCRIHGSGESSESRMAVRGVKSVVCPRIVASRLQLFEYGSVSFTCAGVDGFTGCTVSRSKGGEPSACASTWGVSVPSGCNITPAYLADTGEYWCVARGRRSNTVNITVTVGSVILESPVLPVMEGESVTLSCVNRTNASGLPAAFYQDGFFLGMGATGSVTLRSVSKLHEGHYTCSISESGVSPESWMTVRGRGPPPSDPPCRSCNVYIIVRTVFTVLMVALLLVLLGCLHRDAETLVII